MSTGKRYDNDYKVQAVKLAMEIGQTKAAHELGISKSAIEFYTMLMLSVIFLPFGVTERLAFLSNSAISLMFNSGAKMMVICFLQVMVAKILSAYLTNLQGNPFKDFSILCQLLIMCVFFAYVTKKLPDLVSSFLNGSPALSGGGMIQQARSMAQQTQQVITTAAMTAGTGVGAVGGASAVAAGSGGKMSTLGTLVRSGAQNLMANNSFTQGYARGMKGVVGEDGGLQNSNVGFMQGVRRLAGLERSQEAPKTTASIRDIAANNGRMPTAPEKPSGKIPRDSDGKPLPFASFHKSPSGLTGRKVDSSGTGGKPNPENAPRAAYDAFQPTGQNAGQMSSKETINTRETTTNRETISNKETTSNREAISTKETTNARETASNRETTQNNGVTGSND